jgi:putative membrane protein
MSEPPLGVAIPDTRLHPVYLIIGTAKNLRQAIPYLVVMVFGGVSWWANAAVFALVMMLAVAEWHVKKYSVVGGVLLLRSGVVNRSVRVVPVTRIAALTAYQTMTQRLVGVWQVNVQAPGDRNGSIVTLTCLSGSRLDELRAALGSADRGTVAGNPKPGPGLPTVRRYLDWRRTTVDAEPADDRQVIAVLTATEMVIAAVTNYWMYLILAGALVVWFRFSEYLPIRASEFMEEFIEPRGMVAVLITIVVIAIAASVIVGALRLAGFTLVRDGNVLRNSSGLFGRRTATISADRVGAVRIVEGFWRMLLGYCSVHVEIVGVGRTNINGRMLFPLVRTDRAEALIRRALPELPWPTKPLLALPPRVHRRYLTLPLEYASGFTVLTLFLPRWWALLAVLPLPLGCALGVARAREARWQVDSQSVLLRWRGLLNRHTVIAHRGGSQFTELSSSPWKAKAGVAGFSMRLPSGWGAGIRYMVESDALLLLHTVGRTGTRRDHEM